ncbi:Ribosomal RNA-processing protein 8 [Babesia sp. Xinjiang]|uniref:Ribosomal RNA-processing protein 8 n=1 Tax=Babesia sp. Xinjiang TaxID=462227 RepID=UPI000A2477CE|nr:Ribosomal RNA-processing protein 8 [Babesia sp. Xinjiang]ORM40464.1 Ribosomal RNA-processing protein 8 [Babesia sp. Xinjiang]
MRSKKKCHGISQKFSDHNASSFSKQRNHFSLSNAKQRLRGSRFRSLNERLYTSTSHDNFLYLQKNPNLFDVYHEGYREQISKWPTNPLDGVISWLEGIDKGKIIGDFGCGDALIARTFSDRKVHSFDLVAQNSFITACNMAKVPLVNDSLDISVFCLSLMGQDWPLFILEATRCLKQGGILKIIEVTSRFKSVQLFQKFIMSLGYQNESDEAPNVSLMSCGLLTHAGNKLFYFVAVSIVQ